MHILFENACSYFYLPFFYSQEILDQIANIDLVVNLQCRDDCLVKKHFGADICSHCGKTFDSSNSESTSLNLCLATRTRHAQLKSSAAVDMKDSCMEKFRVYSEQVFLKFYKKCESLVRGSIDLLDIWKLESFEISRNLLSIITLF